MRSIIKYSNTVAIHGNLIAIQLYCNILQHYCYCIVNMLLFLYNLFSEIQKKIIKQYNEKI